MSHSASLNRIKYAICKLDLLKFVGIVFIRFPKLMHFYEYQIPIFFSIIFNNPEDKPLWKIIVFFLA